ncbi:hypothetical protein SELMODRAFT_413409 [Selaginella moellendorffii]|uniref:CHCH domain-containing protein n=1 Tax=Selaginella moellendorffii TaxID=88036 RepID=D8RPC8_SELML|nr:hypothetical protein SELMODRAFT_413409 [Selaginella moellendorffii]
MVSGIGVKYCAGTAGNLAAAAEMIECPQRLAKGSTSKLRSVPEFDLSQERGLFIFAERERAGKLMAGGFSLRLEEAAYCAADAKARDLPTNIMPEKEDEDWHLAQPKWMWPHTFQLADASPTIAVSTVTCSNQIKAFNQCISLNGSACQFYLDLLHECRKGPSASGHVCFCLCDSWKLF